MRAFQKGSQFIAAALFLFFTATSRADTPIWISAQVLTNRDTRLQIFVTNTPARLDVSTNLTDWNGFLSVGASTTHTDTFSIFLPQRFYRRVDIEPTTVFGDHIATTNGDVIIRPIIHASFLMKWNDLIIYNDPDTGNYTGLPKGQLILIGHEHSDHWDAATINNIKATNAVIVANQDVYTSFTAALRAQTIVLRNGDTTNLFGLHIEAVPAYNTNHPKPSDNGYVVTIGGKRFYMSGDTGDTPEMRALQNIDVAFLAMNNFTMTVQQAASAARAFAPKIVYPYHFRNSDGTFANFTTLKSLVGTDLQIDIRIRKWY